MNWGPEETQQTYFPFVKGAPFDLIITCESTHFNVSIVSYLLSSYYLKNKRKLLMVDILLFAQRIMHI